jgi:hypothetical protein
VVTSVKPSAMLTLVRRSWPRTHPVQFLIGPHAQAQFTAARRPTQWAQPQRPAWRHLAVMWDVVKRVCVKRSQVLEMRSLVPVLQVGLICPKSDSTVLYGSHLAVYARVVANTALGEFPMLCLSAVTADNVDVVVLVSLDPQYSATSPKATRYVLNSQQFYNLSRSVDMVVGFMWLTLDRETGTLRAAINTAMMPMSTVFHTVETFRYFHWLCCEVSSKDGVEMYAWVQPGRGCYVRPMEYSGPVDGVIPFENAIRIARAPTTQLKYVPGVHLVYFEPKSRLEAGDRCIDHQRKYKGVLQAVALHAEMTRMYDWL